MPSPERSSTPPRFMRIARDLYGPAFEVVGPAEITEAAADWSQLSEAQRSFAVAHLLYLNLHAQAGVLRQISSINESVEDAADDMSELRDRVRARDRARSETAPTNTEDPRPATESGSTEVSRKREVASPVANPVTDATDTSEAGGLTPLAALFHAEHHDDQEVTHADR